jgi:hypothetical protein
LSFVDRQIIERLLCYGHGKSPLQLRVPANCVTKRDPSLRSG